MKRLALLFGIVVFVTSSLFGGVTGSISGTVTDASGAIVVGADVVALATETGIKTATKTNSLGFYSLPTLAIGQYEIQIQNSGFKQFRQTGLVLDVNTTLRVDAVLQVGAMSQQIEVSTSAVQVEVQSTQMGEVIGTTKMTALPLNGRSYTDLLALQAGVAPTSSGLTSVQYVPSNPSGSLDPGTLSVSGQRENANGFMVNGANVEDGMSLSAAIIPNLDAIAEFRIITNNFDAEYGDYSGGLVNAVTKSGANRLHGDAFEFLRNTSLDARNFYNFNKKDPATGAQIPGSAIGVFRQNQFGGTLGGPIIKDKIFFFGDYQGTRRTIGQSSGLIAVPSAQDRLGNLSDVSGLLTGGPAVQGAYFANNLSTALGYPVTVGEPFYSSGCTSNANCVFPNAVIPKAAWSPTYSPLVGFIPPANGPVNTDFPTGSYSTSGFPSVLRDDKLGFRLDGNTRWGAMAGYYFFDDFNLNNPYDAFGGSDSPLPGFPVQNVGRSQLITYSDTKTFGPSTVNELRLNFMRSTQFGGVPKQGKVDYATLGFTTGCGTLGICIQGYAPMQIVPPEYLDKTGLVFGGSRDALGLWDNTYQVQDNYSKIKGTHTIKIGANFHYDQSFSKTNYLNDGSFKFNGSAESGSDFANFMLGAPYKLTQAIQLPLYGLGKYLGMYGQDSWRVTKTLTFNYGLRWDITTPWYEKHNQLEVAVPGCQSKTFPNSPVGWCYAGDPGIPRTISPTKYGNLAPRVGLAWSPEPQSGILKTLLGGPGKTSIRASWGRFFSALENATDTFASGDSPFGFIYISPTPAVQATPYVDLYTGNSEGQKFPFQGPPVFSSPAHPYSGLNWANLTPITSSPTGLYTNKTPYAENYMFSVERQFGGDTMLSMSYVGSQSHHQMVSLEFNPSNPAVCLSVSQVSEVAPGTTPCGPNGEQGTFTTASGQVVQPRSRYSTVFGSNGWWDAMGNSNFNALEVTLRHNSRRTALLAGYTFSKSTDQASAVEDNVNPYNYAASKALSAFNVTNNFVVSYSYNIPFEKLWRPNRLTQGWIVTGVTRFATGLPVEVYENDDQSLIGNTSTGASSISSDEPVLAKGAIYAQTNPRKGGTYFNTALFSQEPLGTVGNSPRRFFHGPGINNFDMAVLKDVQVTEGLRVEVRGEFFNIFNHAQFLAPSGSFPTSSFGVVTGARDPRIGQVALKLIF